ncbi:hypothetical protein [Kribbella kalugense]|uniref:Uncharacterized protein n=1 Tax=Kribbella kalugense TaxID=2512221 RepID=A0A4R8A0X1_9ACTN|nr:hypothetical protein [Kribbella kalugense]TDW23806.1 hypothetical protein EV650_2665 [Kribbella kalugense]
MANEAEFAHYTDEIAKAVTEVHATLSSVTYELGDAEIGRMLGSRSDDLGTLRRGVDGLFAAEQAVQRAEGAAVKPAKASLAHTFAAYQGDIQQQSASIGSVQQVLDAQRNGTTPEDRRCLRAGAQALQGALKNLETIEHMPDRATDDVAQLRQGVEFLKTVVDAVDERVEQMVGQLSNGRQAAYNFQPSAPGVDDAQPSAKLNRTIGQMRDSLDETRDYARRLHTDLSGSSADFAKVAEHAVNVSNGALAEHRHATKEAEQLADAVRAGVNPTLQADQQPVVSQAQSDLSSRLEGRVDPRIAYSMGAQERHSDNAGPARDQGHGR